jgi:lipopolysaccharide/colanic/teichoic acid biosynthesis glycosyltransferase
MWPVTNYTIRFSTGTHSPLTTRHSTLTMRLKLLNRAGLSRHRAFRDIYSVAQFDRVLRRERARTDRNGDPFALVAFTPREADSAGRTLARLAKILKRRLRFTDEIGWLDSGRIAAVLPSTPAKGAWKVADDVCLAFPPHRHPPHCEVYVYPSEWPAERLNDELAEPLADRDPLPLDALLIEPLPTWKRALDVVGAITGLALLAPVLLLVSVAVKATSRGPVLFRQWRAGRGGQPFLIYKFRSMAADAAARHTDLMALNEQDGPAFKLRRDPRVTPLGRVLRATSLDELPQLWNVLRGEMSLVGPRPLPCHESNACLPWQRRRLDVTPGLTCIWQVHGRSRVTFNEWMRMDLRYTASRSVKQDLKLLAQTVWAVVRGTGAH